ncbi:MAG TPA: ATP-grasp domain-containing protein [Candidatus Paceibacterota bacterium]|nr:ATP-grasp domain-containing protein [Candidatus Paceibacterota bacterium]
MQTIVGVLRGGPSREHEVSLASGHSILSNLSPERYTARDIFIDKQGTWHVAGRPVEPHRALRQVDVVLNALHGEYGEDGEVQKVLERNGVPYTGADSFASYLAAHKALAKERAREVGLKTPRYTLIEARTGDDRHIVESVRSFSQPMVVKPLRWGSSIGVSVVTGYAKLYEAVVDLLARGAGGVLVEEYIRGREATVGVVENLRGEELYTPPPVEIVPPEKEEFFSYSAKYSGGAREVCPAPFTRAISNELMQAARTVHTALGARHYSRSDFIVAPNGVYYLETNTSPGLTNESILPKSLAAAGISLPYFFEHLVNLARAR